MKNTSTLTRVPALAATFIVSALCLPGCKDKALPTPPPPSKAQIQTLVEQTTKQLVVVKGGEFQMGDFRERHPDERPPTADELDAFPVHKVTLSDFSIGRYKVTLGEYDVFAAAHGRPLPYTVPDSAENRFRGHANSMRFPVGVGWNDAQAYCQWIGKQSGQAMDLPTEAEWEYAARARGTPLMHATDNGEMEFGRNYPPPVQPLSDDADDFFADYSVGRYPPNPLGLYDLASHGYEWTSDWYGADYYRHSPENSPKGPESGTQRVLRGVPLNHPFPALTYGRQGREPTREKPSADRSDWGHGFRCVSRGPFVTEGKQ